MTSMKVILAHDHYSTVSRIGSALGADKKINLGCQIPVNVHAAEAAWTAAQRRSADGRGYDLYSADWLSLA